ncbi:MAG: hypothetical protein PHI98_00235 [Eubacteriales bacterium]|nr:hypothetical protein [Eubacteriales bacterium]
MGNTAMIVLAALFILFSPQVMAAATTAAQVFVSGVLPALFPMMILNGLSVALKGEQRDAPGREILTTILFAFAAGSPASAQRLTGIAYRLTRPGRYAMAAATGVMSPMFIVGTLAVHTGQHHASWIMLTAHWLSALLTGWGCRVWLQRTAPLPKPTKDEPLPPQEGKQLSLAAALPGAVSAAAQALLSVCGAMMLFSIVACLLKAMLALLFPGWVAANAKLLSIVWALMEIGGGSFAVLDAFHAPPFALLCALCSFGGLSIWLQNLLFFQNRINPAKLLLIRGLHGVTAYGLCTLLFRLFPQAQAAFSPQGASILFCSSRALILTAALALLCLPNRRRSCP